MDNNTVIQDFVDKYKELFEKNVAIQRNRKTKLGIIEYSFVCDTLSTKDKLMDIIKNIEKLFILSDSEVLSSVVFSLTTIVDIVTVS